MYFLESFIRKKLFSPQLQYNYFRSNLCTNRRSPKAVAVIGDCGQITKVCTSIIQLVHFFRYQTVGKTLACMRMTSQVKIIASICSGIHTARLMIDQNTVVVFILGGKIYKLAVGTVLAVIIYTGYFDFVVDNGIGIAQDVEALVCEHLLPAQWFI